jgi:cardiolipin synthase
MVAVDAVPPSLQLLENGEAFFPRVFAAIAAARRDVLVETFILFEDKVGLALQRHLVDAARRGVRVELTVDGYGSPGFSPDFVAALADAGVRLRVFDPHRPLLGMRVNVFRRMHRKLVVVDGERAFVGGINFSADHLADFGPEAKQDYAVEVAGAPAAVIRDFMLDALRGDGTGESWRPPRVAGASAVRLVARDNRGRTRAIEREYREAIRAARREVLVANAYFFPGIGLLRDLRHAARRGVEVVLIVQGEPDTKFARTAARSLYRHLSEAGVRVHEYCRRPFHGKVAVIDAEWATVGSSNLDPLSLSLNLEANIIARDAALAGQLRASLQRLLQGECRPIEASRMPAWRPWHVLTRPLWFHCLRRFPAWAGLVPAHAQHTALLQADGPEAST